jgi:hypothetical protein
VKKIVCLLITAITVSLYSQHVSAYNTSADSVWTIVPYFIGKKMGYADLSGNIIVPVKYPAEAFYGGTGFFSRNLAIVNLYDPDTTIREWYGLINSKGDLILQSDHIFIEEVTSNIRFVSTSDSSFLIRNNGEMIQLKKYSSVRFNEWGYGLGIMDTAGFLLDSVGQEIMKTWPFNEHGIYAPNGLLALPPSNQRILNDSATYTENRYDEITIINRKGIEYPLKNKIPDFYLYYPKNVKTPLIVQKDDQFAVINFYGQLLVPFGNYSTISDYSGGMACAFRDDLPYYINETGKEIVLESKESKNEELLNAPSYKGGYLKLNVYGKKTYWVFFDKNGKPNRIKGQYDEVGDFSEGLCKVTYGDKFGFINIKGELMIPFLERGYESMGNFSDGFCWFSKGGKYGYIDRNGVEVIPASLPYPRDFIDGFAIMFDEHCGGCSVDIYDKKGQKLPYQVKGEETWQYGYRRIYDGGLVGLMDLNGVVTFPMEYYYIHPINNQIAQVTVQVPDDNDYLMMKKYFVNLKTGLKYTKD